MTDRLALMGRDLALDYRQGAGFYEDADLRAALSDPVAGARDLVITTEVAAISQAIANRLKTRKGELAPLGHPDYGSRHHELIGEPNVERTRNLIKLYVLQSLKREPRITKVLAADVRAQHTPPRDIVRIEITVRLVDEPTPLNLVVPFALEAAP